VPEARATLAASGRHSDGRVRLRGPRTSWLGEAFVHGEDIRRPLGIPRTYPVPTSRARSRSTRGANASSAVRLESRA